MSICYRPVLYLGKKFDGESEVIKFIQEYYNLSPEELSEISDEGIDEWLYTLEDTDPYRTLSKIDSTKLDLYEGREGCGFLVGVDILYAARDPDSYLSTVEDAEYVWESVFPNSECSIIAEVKIS